MPQCAVTSCRNSGVHLFPKDPILRRKWEKAIGRNKSATDFLRLCRDHFKESDYVGISAYTGLPQLSRYLKKGVVPSIFPWTQKSATASVTTEQDMDIEEKSPARTNTMNDDMILPQGNSEIKENIEIPQQWSPKS